MSSLKNIAFRLSVSAAFLAAVATTTPLGAQSLSRAEYIERYSALAVAHAEKYGIPASIKLAQGILESGNGNGTLARRANTHFNIKVKASDNWRGRVVRHDDDAPNEPFRAYDSPEESWLDHSEYLDTQPRYDSLFDYDVKDYRSWARGLKNAGYATDPLYDVKLIRIIEDNRLYLLDSGETLSAGTMLSQATLRQDRQTVSEIALEVASDLVDPDSFVAVVSSRTKNNKKNRINGKRNRP